MEILLWPCVLMGDFYMYTTSSRCRGSGGKMVAIAVNFKRPCKDTTPRNRNVRLCPLMSVNVLIKENGVLISPIRYPLISQHFRPFFVNPKCFA